MRSLDDENDQTTARTVGKFETLHIQSRKEKRKGENEEEREREGEKVRERGREGEREEEKGRERERN